MSNKQDLTADAFIEKLQNAMAWRIAWYQGDRERLLMTVDEDETAYLSPSLIYMTSDEYTTFTTAVEKVVRDDNGN